MTNIFNVIRSVYSKSNIDMEIDNSTNILLVYYLGLDKDNLPTLARIAEFSYYITSDSLFYLIWLSVKGKDKTPFLRGFKRKETEKENSLYEKIRYILGWSQKELDLNRSILDKVIDKSIWKERLGIK